MTLVDHLFLALLLVYPVVGTFSARRYVARAKRGHTLPKPQLYRQTQIVEWSLFAALAAIWFIGDRPVAALGFVAPAGGGFLLALIVAAAVMAWLVHALRSAHRLPADEKTRQVAALGDLVWFLPVTGRDFRHFSALSVTAGIVEETIYRGFLLWYLAAFMPLPASIACSSLIFAAAHAYQGIAGAARVFGVGVVFAGLFVVSGSLWIPIVLHVLADVLQGAAAKALIADSGDGAGPGPVGGARTGVNVGRA